MEKYCLYVLFQLVTDSGETTQDKISMTIDCEDIFGAEAFLQQKVSEKLSHYSDRGLNWKILEKHVKLESDDYGDTLKKGMLRSLFV